ncbi:anaerobic ribonucleoside-triphosphate reductase activating protein [Thermobrachium celere]|uniref:Anaerobic ribonucleoside-triphosphate reductase-activating protein n=1 Tax=Thermobrachium celere DSM 8682 TaxID=941824 RepID=R7RP56_9CLOT|nr:anaerobic ribonucleoside-triphosphate reductase activating protein [Thermobrachium celere]CDF57844.1 Ribonucleotide reductase of class III (anaerobic), activating protein [Thermobrachium celere DSM 8682]
MKIRIAGINRESLVDGPGIRYVIFSQGCFHNCRGCHNKETHPLDGGYEVELDYIYNDIIQNKYIDGVTFSGGDPFVQVEKFIHLAKRLKEKNIHIICYTGYLYDDILKDSKKRELLNYIDILIDGPFVLEQRTLKKPFVGSLNQRIIDVKKSLKENKIIEVKW